MKLITIFILAFLYCKGQKEVMLPPPSAISLFCFGEILKSGKPFQKMEKLLFGEILNVSPKAFCDLQIENKDWVFRVKGPARFELKQIIENQKESWDFQVQEGILQVKISEKLKINEEFKVSTPTGVMGVRGTSFQVEVDSNGTSKFSVLEGEVSVQPNIARASSSPKLMQALTEKEIRLKKSQKIEWNTSILQKWEKIPQEKETEIIQDLELYASKEIKPLSSLEVSSLVSDFQSLNPLPLNVFQDSKTLETSIQNRIQTDENGILGLMENMTKIKRGTITLTSGREIKGLIEQTDKVFKVQTPSGVQIFQESEVLEINNQ
jgi:hypothetical protein